MPGGQVVLEGCYQLFINSSLNSSCGQLKVKHIYVKKWIISLTLHTVPFFLNIDTPVCFRIDLGRRLNLINASFVICEGIIAVRSENHSRNFSTAEVHKSRTPVLYNLAPNIYGFSEVNTLHVNFSMVRILMRFLHIRKIWWYAIYTSRNITQCKLWYHHPVLLLNGYMLPLSERRQGF